MATDALKEAQKRYQEAIDGTSSQRRQVEEDLEFTDPSDPQQWDDREKMDREGDPGGARPCLVHDQLGQYIANVSGQIEQRPPALHALPVNGGADRKVAEKLDGFFRQIEYASRGQQHYIRALTSAARAGVGYLLVTPEYTDRALNYQEPRIGSEGDPLRIVIDPWSVELDGSDAEWGTHLTPLSHRAFEREAGAKADKVSFGDSSGTTIVDDRESVVVATEWEVITESANCIVARNAAGDEISLSEDEFHEQRQRDPALQFVRNYREKRRKVMWRRMSGATILQESEYPASSIGIVPVYGYVGWSKGRMHYCGIGRRGRHAQRAYNYHISELRAFMNQAPKAPWWVPLSAVQSENHKALLDKLSVESRAWMPYVDWDPANNRAIPPPTRSQVSINLQNHIEGAEQALRDIQASLGMYQASLGAPSNETSGVAIEGRKQQGEAATTNFPAHLSASVAQVGRICMEMIPKLIDTKRQLRVLSIDNTPSQITVDPKQTKPLQESEEAGGALTINPNIGKYDVRVVVGASFSTQRAQAQEAYTEMMRANPEMMPALAPLWAQTLDVPHTDKLAQVLTAMAPPAVQAILNPEQEVSTASLQAKVEKLEQALKQATDIAHEAQQDADQAHAELEKLSADAEAKEEENVIKAYEAQTKRMQALGTALTPEAVQLLVAQTIENMLRHPDPMPGEEGGDQLAPAPSPQEPQPEQTGPSGDLPLQPGLDTQGPVQEVPNSLPNEVAPSEIPT
jgi:hypothetical protein